MSQKIWEEVRGGVEHFHLQGHARPKGPLRQFFHGMSLPFHVALALLKNPAARRTYVRVGLLQTVAALVLALTCMTSGKGVAEKAESEDDDARSAAIQRTAAKLAEAQLRRAKPRTEQEARRVDEALRQLHESLGRTPSVRDEGEASADEEAVQPRREDAESAPERREDAKAAAVGVEDAGIPRSASGAVAAAPSNGEDADEATRDEEDSDGTAARAAAASETDAGSRRRRSRAERQAERDARLQQRIQDLEAAAQGDGGTSLPRAIAALALEAARTAKDESKDESSSVDADDEDEDRRSDDADDDAPEASLTNEEDGGTTVAAAPSTPPSDDGDKPPRGLRVKIRGEDSYWMVRGFSLWSLAFWAALFGALHLAQFVVIALSRDYHDVIARDASLLTGVTPEDAVTEPRVRLDMQWLRKKMKRRWRAWWLFAVGVPALALVALPFLCLSTTVFTVLSSLWGLWWLVVFTAAKSEQAWVPPAEPRTPWFLRAWTWLTTRVPGLRWGVLQRYGAFWTRKSEELSAPMATVERHPWAFAGLAVVRFVGSTPPLKFFFRPLIPVASAHLLAEETAARAAAIPPVPKPQIPAGETGA
ncbi:hypothetical protein JY651_25150 [Pyxidicoccus parkwayensis]|uniref:DAD domain-containing protein n=1 Tax=Pyxidicoccus parkwayensis TaxID=2813578 RepID=A0ABX7NII7_9BACT|nr:hypothetical protein [Pyxidicoccus parkwaysis]QSQ18656.1 hypothetical protein JY651_25150 [Pyxidicoccus parkwaysis]